ncbi:Ger(x)C family spore germination C-terminal domain-containing protein [Brevibacillus agri]|uniref:Ger(x)C family spore germination C-terminal domain-containing protein n=1 Tax=Brevibacillus agri TaxID=51101 RepID=UPI0028700FC8|nr:Ger(x)C family spore germination C-terminal domain-containing protein [Brevibacillus agri]
MLQHHVRKPLRLIHYIVMIAITLVLTLSPLTSLLHQPKDVYEQRSFIEPMQLYRFIANFWEPSNTVLLPNITIYERSWKENNHYVSRLTIDGVHALHRGTWKGYFPSRDLMGLRWMDEDTDFAGLIIRDGNTPKATIRIKHVGLKIVPVTTGPMPRYHLHVHLLGFIRELISPEISPEQIQKNSEEQVREQIRGTFLKGVQKGTDLYGLERELFKKDYRAWRMYEKAQRTAPTRDSIASIQIHVHLSDSGKMKMESTKYPSPLGRE